MNQLGYLLHRATRLVDQEFAARLRELGLTPRQASVLMMLVADEPSTPSQLSQRLGIDRATMSGLIARLGRDGWIAVESNPADRRSQTLRLTSRSSSALLSIRSASQQAQEHVLGGLEPATAESLLRALAELVDSQPSHPSEAEAS